MLKCICCGKEVSNDTYLFNHIIRFSQYDEEHCKCFKEIIESVKDLFYDINFYNRSTKTFDNPQKLTINYDNAKKLWQQEFGANATKERLAITKQKSVAIGVTMQQHNCSREEAERLLTKNYDLSHIKPDQATETKEYDTNSNLCPVCGKSFGRSLLNHCKIFYNTHKEFLEQQKQLIIPLFNNYDINKTSDLKQINILFSYSYYHDIWIEHYGFDKIEEKRKILERKAKSNTNRTIEHVKHTGRLKALDLNEYKNDLIIPEVNFSYKNIKNDLIINDLCQFCNTDISQTTMWNHCVLNRSDKQHSNFLLNQMNIALQLFNDLSFNVDNKNEYTNRNLYIGGQTIKKLWECFDNTLITQRKEILKKKSNIYYANLIPYAKVTNGRNPYLVIDWSKFDIEAIKNEQLNLNYDVQTFNDVNNRICPICHEPTERLLFEHLKYKRLDQKHLIMFEEQIKLIIQMFFCKDLNQLKQLKSNLLFPIDTCETIYSQMFSKQEANEKMLMFKKINLI